MITYTPPYYMKNKDWYYYDPRHERVRLTDKATQKAVDSYVEHKSVHVFWGDNSPEFISYLFEKFTKEASDDIKEFKENKRHYTFEYDKKFDWNVLVAIDGKKI